jgi:DNA-nicking Smr family endonuclease
VRRPRSLAPEEAALWRRVASTVRPLVPPLVPPANREIDQPQGNAEAPSPAREVRPVAPRPLVPSRAGEEPRPVSRPLDRHGLDAGWERRLARGLIEPDFTLDLHGATLDAAYARLGHGLAQARVMGARVVLLITGRSRPVEAADRGRMRGAIRAKIGDWIAAGEHGAAIAAIRPAHRRHGGPGALYLVLRRRR